eukprot:2370198-Rhodomonas_salina.1
MVLRGPSLVRYDTGGYTLPAEPGPRHHSSFQPAATLLRAPHPPVPGVRTPPLHSSPVGRPPTFMVTSSQITNASER